MDYRCITDMQQIRDYLNNTEAVAFDFETAPIPEYRADPQAALDAHKANIVGISLSVKEGSAIYVPLRHLEGNNADSEQVVPFLRDALWMNKAIQKIAHNLALLFTFRTKDV